MGGAPRGLRTTGPTWAPDGGRGQQECHAFAFDQRTVRLDAPPRALPDAAQRFKRPPVLAEFRLAASLSPPAEAGSSAAGPDAGSCFEAGCPLLLATVHLRSEAAEARLEAAALGDVVLPALQARTPLDSDSGSDFDSSYPDSDSGAPRRRSWALARPGSSPLPGTLTWLRRRWSADFGRSRTRRAPSSRCAAAGGATATRVPPTARR